MRFDSPGQLRCKINVFFLSRVINVNQYSPLNIRQVQSVIDVSPAAFLRTSSAISVLISRLTAYLQGVLIPRTELNYIWFK